MTAIRDGEPTLSFRYRDYGNMATIGRAAAIADVGRVRLITGTDPDDATR